MRIQFLTAVNIKTVVCLVIKPYILVEGTKVSEGSTAFFFYSIRHLNMGAFASTNQATWFHIAEYS